MLIFAAAQVGQPDYLALAMVVAFAITVGVMVLRKHNARKAAKAAPVATAEPTPVAESVEAPVAPGSAGKLKLHDVDPKVAAMCMAIVADKLGKPLNELRFISIKEVK